MVGLRPELVGGVGDVDRVFSPIQTVTRTLKNNGIFRRSRGIFERASAYLDGIDVTIYDKLTLALSTYLSREIISSLLITHIS